MKNDPGYEKRAESLGLFLDEAGFITCKARIGRARVPYTTRFPILIPAKNYVTRLSFSQWR